MLTTPACQTVSGGTSISYPLLLQPGGQSKMKQSVRFWNVMMVFVLVISLALAVPGVKTVEAVSPDIVISQVYGGGGNSGATLKNDFIELYNLGTSAVDVTGWTVQYASTSGSTWQRTILSGIIQPGSYYLVQEAQGTGGTVDLPPPNAIGTISMSSSAGKVALVNNSVLLSGTCPIGLVDFVGYGSLTNCFEGAPTANLSNTTAALRKSDGTQDTDNNSVDFLIAAPTPRNTPPPDSAPSVASTTPTNGAGSVAVDADVSVTFSEPVNVAGSWFDLTCGPSGTHTAVVLGGPTTFTLNPNFDFSN